MLANCNFPVESFCESKGTESKNLEGEKSVRKFSPKKSRTPSDYTYRIRVNYT